MIRATPFARSHPIWSRFRHALARGECDLRHAVDAFESGGASDPPARVAEDRSLNAGQGGEVGTANAGPAGREGQALGEAPALGRDGPDVPVASVLARVDDELRRLRRCRFIRPFEVEHLELDDGLTLGPGERHLHRPARRHRGGGVADGVADDALRHGHGAPEGGVVVGGNIVPRRVHRPENVANGVRGGTSKPAFLRHDPLAVVGRVDRNDERPIDLFRDFRVARADLSTEVLPDEPEGGEKDGGVIAATGAARLVVIEVAGERVVRCTDIHHDVTLGQLGRVARPNHDDVVRDQP